MLIGLYFSSLSVNLFSLTKNVGLNPNSSTGTNSLYSSSVISYSTIVQPPCTIVELFLK